MSDNFDLGKRIKTARKDAKMTQSEVAKKANLAIGTIKQYEAGKRTPDISTCTLLAAILNVPFDYFLSEKQVDSIVGLFADNGYPLDPAPVFSDKVRISAQNPELYDSSEQLNILFDAFIFLNEQGRKKAIERVEELTEVEKYKLVPGLDFGDIKHAPAQNTDTDTDREAQNAIHPKTDQ